MAMLGGVPAASSRRLEPGFRRWNHESHETTRNQKSLSGFTASQFGEAHKDWNPGPFVEFGGFRGFNFGFRVEPVGLTGPLVRRTRPS
jgi:hypothetical protein